MFEVLHFKFKGSRLNFSLLSHFSLAKSKTTVGAECIPPLSRRNMGKGQIGDFIGKTRVFVNQVGDPYCMPRRNLGAEGVNVSFLYLDCPKKQLRCLKLYVLQEVDWQTRNERRYRAALNQTGGGPPPEKPPTQDPDQDLELFTDCIQEFSTKILLAQPTLPFPYQGILLLWDYQGEGVSVPPPWFLADAVRYLYLLMYFFIKKLDIFRYAFWKNHFT